MFLFLKGGLDMLQAPIVNRINDILERFDQTKIDLPAASSKQVVADDASVTYPLWTMSEADPILPFEMTGGATKKRRVQGGKPSTKVVVSAHLADNAEVFPHVLDLHVAPGSTVADLTYGQGVFWRNVPETAYQLLKSDLKIGQCWTDLPYENGSVDAVVFDPPYMEGLYRKSTEALAGSGTHSAFQKAYSNSSIQKPGGRKYHDAVLEAYLSVVPEVKRILRSGGTFIVKCQDEVSANRQKLTHIELVWALEHHGFYCKDVFIVVRRNAPVISRLLKQEHARKNHSYFLVFVRQDERKRLAYSNFSSWLREDETSGDQ
jgi:hypothetical protein